MANPLVHFEQMNGNVYKATAFHESMYDWMLEDVPGLNYTIVQADRPPSDRSKVG